MANIKLIRFSTGEEIVAEITKETDTTICIKDAVSLVYRPKEGGQMSVGFGSFMPYSDGEISLNKTTILAQAEVQDDLKNEFNRIFGSGIVLAQANDAAFKA